MRRKDEVAWDWEMPAVEVEDTTKGLRGKSLGVLATVPLGDDISDIGEGVRGMGLEEGPTGEAPGSRSRTRKGTAPWSTEGEKGGGGGGVTGEEATLASVVERLGALEAMTRRSTDDYVFLVKFPRDATKASASLSAMNEMWLSEDGESVMTAFDVVEETASMTKEQSAETAALIEAVEGSIGGGWVAGTGGGAVRRGDGVAGDGRGMRSSVEELGSFWNEGMMTLTLEMLTTNMMPAPPITCALLNPRQLPNVTGKGNYTEYCVSCTQGRLRWTVRHRYNDFSKLHKQMKVAHQEYTDEKKAAGEWGVVETTYVMPHMPSKKKSVFGFGNMDKGFIETRRARIQAYVQIQIHAPI